MSLWKSLRGKHQDVVGNSSEPSSAQRSRNGKISSSASILPSSYGASNASSSSYAPPTGPPPSHNKLKHESYQPPPGAPPSHAVDPPPYHDWTVIPDTTLLPPPPALDNETSPTGNATEEEALRAHIWCYQRPLYQPRVPDAIHLADAQNGNISLIRPPEYKGNLAQRGTGKWGGHTKLDNTDSLLVSHIPLYFAAVESPLQTERRKLLYFEVKLLSFGHKRGDKDALALGYCAIPTPTWRLPGWERGSIGVHSDDGRRYVSDTEGGKDFTSSFKAGETIGIGITFDVPKENPHVPMNRTPMNGQVIFTRNGRQHGGWDIHEEVDAANEFGVLGIDGKYDLFAAVGIYGKVEFEVCFRSEDWMWRP